MDFRSRLGRAREAMRKSGVRLMFLTYGANLWYLTGFHRRRQEVTDSNTYGDYMSGAYVGADDDIMLVAPRMGGVTYQQEAAGKPWISEVRILDESENPKSVLIEVLDRFGIGDGGISLDDRAWSHTSQLLRERMPRSRFSIASEIIAPMRMIKDSDEVEAMQKAGRATDEVFGEIVKYLRIGITEYEVAAEIDHQFARRGSEYPSFNTGIRFARPGKASVTGTGRTVGRKLEKNDGITFDFGTCLDGYCSDFGRTVFVGDPPAEFRKIHDLVMESQAVGIEKMVSGTITAQQLDRVARSVIEKAGYGSCFTHRLGHGIGVTVHEPPFLYKPDDTLLKSGMTFTVEPSIRLSEGYGCRVEDVVMVTEKGGVPFSNYSKELTLI